MRQRTWLKGIITSLCVATGTLAITACGDDDNDDDGCTSGAQGTFECGVGQIGTQSQECVEGEWYFVTECTDADGNDVDLGPGDVPPIKDAPGNGNNGGNGGNGETAERPTDPDTCQKLATADLDGAKTLPEHSCYLVESELIVSNGTLTIERGVTLFMGYGSKITVGGAGRIQATGDADNNIWFIGTNDERGHWDGIKFRETGNGQNLLDHVLLRHAGHSRDNGSRASTRAGVYTDYYSKSLVNLTLSNSHIADTLGFGASLRSSGDVIVENTSFENNEKSLAIHINNMGGLDKNITFENIDTEEILVFERDVTEEAVWPGFDTPYHFIHFRPTLEAKVTIQPGATLQFEEDAHLFVPTGGRLYADASAGDPIVFTGVETDIAGFWRGITIESVSGDNVLNNVTISYGGSDSANLMIGRDAHATVQDLTLSHSGGHGISSKDNARLLNCTGLTFTDIAGNDFDGAITGVADCE